jgi:hypothetical protein
MPRPAYLTAEERKIAADCLTLARVSHKRQTRTTFFHKRRIILTAASIAARNGPHDATMYPNRDAYLERCAVWRHIAYYFRDIAINLKR